MDQATWEDFSLPLTVYKSTHTGNELQQQSLKVALNMQLPPYSLS